MSKAIIEFNWYLKSIFISISPPPFWRIGKSQESIWCSVCDRIIARKKLHHVYVCRKHFLLLQIENGVRHSPLSVCVCACAFCGVLCTQFIHFRRVSNMNFNFHSFAKSLVSFLCLVEMYGIFTCVSTTLPSDIYICIVCVCIFIIIYCLRW